MSTKLNYKAILLYGVVLAAIVLVALYFLMPTGPVRVTVDSVIASLKLPKIDLNAIVPGVFNWVKDNTIATGAIVSLGTTAITYFVKEHQAKKLLDQKISELQQEKLNALSLTDTAKTLQEKLNTFESDETASQLQTSLSSMKTEYDKVLSAKDATIQTLKEQLTEANTKLTSIPYREVTVVK